jgi:hypothetical protein
MYKQSASSDFCCCSTLDFNCLNKSKKKKRIRFGLSINKYFCKKISTPFPRLLVYRTKFFAPVGIVENQAILETL